MKSQTAKDYIVPASKEVEDMPNQVVDVVNKSENSQSKEELIPKKKEKNYL